VNSIFAAFPCLLALLVATPARAELSIYADLQHYQWKEAGSPEVKISGWLPGIGVNWLYEHERGWGSRYRGGIYGSSLKYESGSTFSGTIHYGGVVNELDALYRLPNASILQFVAGAGVDYWERESSFTGLGQQSQDWKVAFLRFGVNAGSSRGWQAGAGVKFPVFTDVRAHLQEIGYDSSPRLNPDGNVSGYASLDYRLSSHWKAGGYYEGYRFAASPAVNVTSQGVPVSIRTPQSKQDSFGVRLEYVF